MPRATTATDGRGSRGSGGGGDDEAHDDVDEDEDDERVAHYRGMGRGRVAAWVTPK